VLAQASIGAALDDAEQGLAGFGNAGKGVLAALGPGKREIDRALDVLARGGQRDALVELHLDVGAEQTLDLDGALRGEQVRGAVDVRLEGDAIFGDFAQLRQAHDLEAAGVREDGTVPAHEAVQAAQPGDALRTGAQHEMIGVGEHDIDAAGSQLVGGDGFHRRRRANRHKGRRADHPARRGDLAEAGTAVRLDEIEGEAVRHGPGAGWSRQASP
jgi:hypothetical protein